MRDRFGSGWTRRALLVGCLGLAAAMLGCGGGGGGGGDSSGGNGGNNGGGGGGGSTNNRTLTGRVTNALTGAAISGATVSAAGVQNTTTADGSFTLSGLPSTGNLTVTFQASGYTTVVQEVTSTATTTINVAMQPSGGSIGDVSQPPPPPDFDSF